MFKKLFNTMIVDWQSGSSFVLGIFFRILPNLDLSLVYNLSFERPMEYVCTQNYFVYSFQVDDDDLSMNHMLCDYHEKGLGSSVWAWKSNQDLKSWYCKLDWLEIQGVQTKFFSFFRIFLVKLKWSTLNWAKMLCFREFVVKLFFHDFYVKSKLSLQWIA